MHGYSTDSGERRVVPLLLASVAIALAWLSSNILAVMHVSLPWWLDAPSTLGYYGLLYALFDNILWRNRFVRNLGLVRVPNLAGRWRGYRSCSAVIQVDDPDGLSLTYQYQNQPLANAMRTMDMHYGTAMLQMSDDNSLTGDYYAGRDRRTFGRICCRKEQNTDIERGANVLEIALRKQVSHEQRVHVFAVRPHGGVARGNCQDTSGPSRRGACSRGPRPRGYYARI